MSLNSLLYALVCVAIVCWVLSYVFESLQTSRNPLIAAVVLLVLILVLSRFFGLG